jgi:hypothetical protein
MKRFCLLHAKSDDDERITRLLATATAAVERASKGQPFQIVPGRDQFNARFKACGSWDAWATEVAAGVDYATRQPLFHGFLVPSNRVGAGTAKIVEGALAARKPVFVFRGDSSVAKVLAVQCIDAKDWQTGWNLTIGNFT